MREDNKRWLMSRMKTSGSKRYHIVNGTYADERHLAKIGEMEDLPLHESIKSTQKFYNNKINYGLLVRFLRGNVGKNWSDVHKEIISRIPTKLLDYKEMIYWFVADQIEYNDEKLWNKRTQKFLYTEHYVLYPNYEFKEFYVDPDSNILHKIPVK